MAFLAGRMIWEFGYRRSKMEKIYRRIRTVYTTANTDRIIKAVFPTPSPPRTVTLYAGLSSIIKKRLTLNSEL